MTSVDKTLISLRCTDSIATGMVTTIASSQECPDSLSKPVKFQMLSSEDRAPISDQLCTLTAETLCVAVGCAYFMSTRTSCAREWTPALQLDTVLSYCEVVVWRPV